MSFKLYVQGILNRFLVHSPLDSGRLQNTFAIHNKVKLSSFKLKMQMKTILKKMIREITTNVLSCLIVRPQMDRTVHPSDTKMTKESGKQLVSILDHLQLMENMMQVRIMMVMNSASDASSLKRSIRISLTLILKNGRMNTASEIQ